MKKLQWWQYFAVGSFIAGWLARALPDGEISREEVDELLNGIFDMLGLDDIKIT